MPLEDFCALDGMNAFWLQMVWMILSLMSLCRLTDSLHYLSGSSLSSLLFLVPLVVSAGGTSFLFLPFPFCAGVFLPPRYLQPIRTLESCFALTWKSSHASFAIPIEKYFLLSLSQTAAAKILIIPFFGLCLKHAALCLGKIVFSTFLVSSCSDVWGSLSFTGSRNPSGTFI